MKFFVETQTGKILRVDDENSDTIEALKTQLQDQEGIKPDQYLLIFNGQILKDHRTAADYSIQKESVLLLVRKLPGNMRIFIETSFSEKIITLDVDRSTVGC